MAQIYFIVHFDGLSCIAVPEAQIYFIVHFDGLSCIAVPDGADLFYCAFFWIFECNSGIENKNVVTLLAYKII